MRNSIVPAGITDSDLPAIAAEPGAPPVPYDRDHWVGVEEEEKGDQSVRLRRYWAAIKRFWWLVAGLTAVGTAAGVIGTRYIPPEYEAKGAVWIADVTPPGGNPNGGPIKNPELLPNGSWIELFRSYAVVDRVVARRQMWYKPKARTDSAALAGMQPTLRTVGGDYTLVVDPATRAFTLTELKRGVVDRGVIGDSIGNERNVGIAFVPTFEQLFEPGQPLKKRTIGFWVSQPRPIAAKLVKHLEVAMQDNSNFLRLTYTGPNRWQTADILNTWMQAFIDKAAELRKGNTEDVVKILDTQRDTAEAEVTAAEEALRNFRASHMTEPGEGSGTSTAIAGGSAMDALQSEYFHYLTDYENTKHDRQALEEIASMARQGGISPEAITAIPAAANAPGLMAAVKDLIDKEAKLRDQRQTFTDSYKPVHDLAASVDGLRTQVIPAQAAIAARVLRTREDELAAKIRTDSVKLSAIPGRSIEEAQLRRKLALAEGLYTQLQSRAQTTTLSAVSTLPDVSILDPALPAASPQRNTIILLVVGGCLGSLLLGVALALLLDIVDHRFRYPEQITHELRLDVLGAVPAVPKPGDAHKDPEAMLQSVEAFRGLRMNLHHAFDAPPVQITITSPGAGDGKSMIASNLALSFSEAGYRTLLIDGDIRRGKLHSVFNVDRRPGLLDYLAGDVDVNAILRTAPVHNGLTIIPSGTRRHRGPELLTSARMPALLQAVRTRYDVILVDSAPLAAGIDPFALGVATGSMMIVMRTGVTDRRVAKAKLKLVQRLPIRMVGAVVNAVPAAGLYNEYSYLYGYSPDIDSESAHAGEIPVLRPAETKA